MHRFALACAFLLLTASGLVQGADGMRTLSGALFYLQRIALAPDSVVVVEFRDQQGQLQAESRFPTEGRQIPLPFALRIPITTRGTLRSALWSHGRPTWLSEPLAIAAGSEPQDVGEVRLHPFEAEGFATRMRCGETTIAIAFADDQAHLRIDGETLVLHPARSASGARFEAPGDPDTFFWSQGNEALVGVRGNRLPACVPAVPAAAEPFTASGNEPGWSLQIQGAQIRLSLDYGARVLQAALPPAQRDQDALRYVLPDAGITITIRDQRCDDDMSGMPHPARVVLETEGRRLQGCGGDPRDLLEGAEWTVTAIDGEPVPEAVEATLKFLEPDRIAGSSGCNRFMGGYELTGEGLSFGTLAGTMMACPEPKMAFEQQFLARLQQVARFELTAEGTLVLVTQGGQRITAARSTQGSHDAP